MSIVAELKRRKVVQVAIIYAVAAWANVEIVVQGGRIVVDNR